MEIYHLICCNVLWREISYFAYQTNNILRVTYLEQMLHVVPELLRDRLQSAIDTIDLEEPEKNNVTSTYSGAPGKTLVNSILTPKGDVSAILLGYGLCSNGISGLKARNTKLVVMRAHDCITFLLGSKERYMEYFNEHPGTYWYSPGWIDTATQPGKDRYSNSYEAYVELYGEENAEYLMEVEQGWFSKYNNAAYVDSGFLDKKLSNRYKEYTKECAEWLKWKYDYLQGDTSLMRDFIDGNWDDERFLVVEPGQTIKASNDSRIIKAEWV